MDSPVLRSAQPIRCYTQQRRTFLEKGRDCTVHSQLLLPKLVAGGVCGRERENTGQLPCCTSGSAHSVGQVREGRRRAQYTQLTRMHLTKVAFCNFYSRSFLFKGKKYRYGFSLSFSSDHHISHPHFILLSWFFKALLLPWKGTWFSLGWVLFKESYPLCK